MDKLNCWEVMGCGREPGGARVAGLGVCPACTQTRMHGVHGGANGGRACWAVVGTLCDGQVQGTFAAKMQRCDGCAFYERVRREEGTGFQLAPLLLARLRGP